MTLPFLRAMAERYPQAADWIESFIATARRANWKNIVAMRAVYPHADLVSVKSGGKVVVLNVAGNKFRLIIACHFNRQTIFTLRFLTHDAYSKGKWKTEL